MHGTQLEQKGAIPVYLSLWLDLSTVMGVISDESTKDGIFVTFLVLVNDFAGY